MERTAEEILQEREANKQRDHRSVDGYKITVGARFWDNGLTVVTVEEVATNFNDYADTGCRQTWHKCTGHGGVYDTLDGHLQHIGRLVRYYGGLNAENYPAGTQYADVK